MGSYANVIVNGKTIFSEKAGYGKWYFKDKDRVREVSEEDEDSDFIGYRVTGGRLLRRMNLKGYNIKSAKRDFEEVKESWIQGLNRGVVSFEQGLAEFDDDDIESIRDVLDIVQNRSFEDWSRVLFQKLDGTTDSSEVDHRLMSLYESRFDGSYDDLNGYDVDFSGHLFPCKSVENYTVILLNHYPNGVDCELDITELVNDGYVSDFDDIAQIQAGNTFIFESFRESLSQLSELNRISVNESLQRMLFVSAITTMEAYLFDIFKLRVLQSNSIKRLFVESHNSNSFKEKISKKDIFSFMDKLDNIIGDEINKISFHNINIVKDLYKRVLRCDITEVDVKKLRLLISKRHDIVHRNGKKLDGTLIQVTQHDVLQLIELLSGVIKAIDLDIIDGLRDDDYE